MRLNHMPLIVFSGIVWLLVGFSLLIKGLNFLVLSAQFPVSGSFSLIEKVSPLAGGREQGSLVLIVLGLMIGFFKGRYVLSKTVGRVVSRIRSQAAPLKLSKVYSPGYIAVLLLMGLMGMAMKWLNVPQEVRGLIDVAIGSALINGALLYFRMARTFAPAA